MTVRTCPRHESTETAKAICRLMIMPFWCKATFSQSAVANTSCDFCLIKPSNKLPRIFAFRRKSTVTGKEDRGIDVGSFIGQDKQIIFGLKILRAATGNFHEDNKLGEGGFGPVYKGTMPDGKQIAVKKLSSKSRQGKEVFLNEVKLVAKFQHRNLVNLVGCCAEGSECLLVYEFLPNNSLDKILFHPQRSNELEWQTRLKIICGIARGLLYLHEDSQVRIIHRDIKTSNILLDEKMDPKISDFGLARLLGQDETHVSTVVAGTIGYLAPEYVLHGQLSAKTDVYGFGIVLLEIVCGRSHTDMNLPPECQCLLELVWRFYKTGNIVDVIDRAIIENCPREHVSRCVQVGLLCTQADASLRPPMSTVYTMLTNLSIANLPNPTEPPFMGVSHEDESTSVSTNSTTVSSSDDSSGTLLVRPSINHVSIIEQHSGVELVPAPIITTNCTDGEIMHIKSYCDESHLIGEGSFARVYRGYFRDKNVAVKKIEHRHIDSRQWIENEVNLLQGKKHKNINSLYGWCIGGHTSYLVYKYVRGCTLENYLRGDCIGFPYSWKNCLGMIRGLAEGIEFLHNNKIIHVDIKPQNIMVGANGTKVKLVDFGFSRNAHWEGTHRSTDKIIGTKGYWAPEYCFYHQLSYKHDVYSFGIVVLEMITGQRHVDNARSSSQFHIPGYVHHMMANHRFEEAVDKRLTQNGGDHFSMETVLTVANIALRCVHPNKDDRPYMDVVVEELLGLGRKNSQS